MLLTAATGFPANAQETQARIPFPVEWTADNWQTIWAKGGTAWNANSAEQAWAIMGRKSNWKGSVHTTAPIDFPENKEVELTFMYKSSCEVTLTMQAYTETDDTLWEQVATLPASNTDYTAHSLTMEVPDAADFRFLATPNIGVMANGNFYIRDINFAYPSADIATQKILSPCTGWIAADAKTSISARFANISTVDADNVVVAYSIDGTQTVKETLPGGLSAGQSIDYTFANPVASFLAGDHTLKVWCEAVGDSSTGNDEISMAVKASAPATFPFIDKFDNQLSNWSVDNCDSDAITWTAGTLNQTDGIAILPSGASHIDDYMWTRPIAINGGNARISFYYSTQLGRGSASLRLIGGTTPCMTEMTELLRLDNISNRGWINAYVPFNNAAAGVWYFAVVAEGNSDGLIIDNFKIDAEEDLCMDAVVFDTESGFNKANSTVTVSLLNHGVSPQSGIRVGYSINGLENQVVETISGPIRPGEKYTHVFSVPADISAHETYTLYEQILTPVGTDSQNDLIAGQQLTHWPNKHVPYVQTFHTDLDQWKLIMASESLSNWGFTPWGVFNAYYGTNVLSHLNAAGAIDDWAISECIEMSAGIYDISFFYRTELNNEGENARQSFALMMGSDRTPEALSTPIAKYEDFTVGRPAYRKSITRIVIPEDGKYYFGFHNYSPANGGSTFIDGFTVKKVEIGYALPYTSDFKDHADEWTLYNPNAKFTQWTLGTEEDGSNTLMVDHDKDASTYRVAEGLIVSPKINIEEGVEVVLNLEYALISDFEEIALNLCGSTVDDADAFSVIAELPATDEFVKYETTIPAFNNESEYFIGLRSNQPLTNKTTVPKDPKDIYTIKIKSLTMTPKSVSVGVDSTEEADQISVSRQGDEVVVYGDGSDVNVKFHDLSGRLIKSFAGIGSRFVISGDGLEGIVILTVSTEKETRTFKMVF